MTTSPIVHCSCNRNNILRLKFIVLVCVWVCDCSVWPKLVLTWHKIPGSIVRAFLSFVINLSVNCVARMSVNPPKHELIQLIYRHLKEHGFHSAAKELQKHSPQVNTQGRRENRCNRLSHRMVCCFPSGSPSCIFFSVVHAYFLYFAIGPSLQWLNCYWQ